MPDRDPIFDQQDSLDLSIDIETLDPGDDLQEYLADKVVVPAMATLQGEHPEVVDYGSGMPTQTIFLGRRLAADASGKRVQLIAYDPNLHAVSAEFIQRANRLRERGELVSFSVANELPIRADCVLAQYSLHHTPNIAESIQREIGQQLAPEKIIIVEFDLQEISQEDFQKLFWSSDAGRKEFETFVDAEPTHDRAKAWQACYDYHRRYNRGDYIRMLETAGYRVDKIILPDPTSGDRGRFIASATKSINSDSGSKTADTSAEQVEDHDA